MTQHDSQNVPNGFVRPLHRGRTCLIGVAGGTASGKSSVCRLIKAQLSTDQQRNVEIVCQDSFYKSLNEQEMVLAKQGKFNFDHPNAFDFDLMYDVLEKIQSGQTAQIPEYDYKTNARVPGKFHEVQAVDVVLVEGILVLQDARCRDMFRMKIFVDADPDIRLARRVQRDMAQRGRDLNMILSHYEQYVKPAFDDFCLPSKKYADIIIPRGSANEVAINLMVRHIQDFLTSPRVSPSNSSEYKAVGSLETIQQAVREQPALNENTQLNVLTTVVGSDKAAPEQVSGGSRTRRTASRCSSHNASTTPTTQTPH